MYKEKITTMDNSVSAYHSKKSLQHGGEKNYT